MVGTVETGIWERDGMYLSLKAGADVTLGQVVRLDTSADQQVLVGTAAQKINAIGVAIAGYRTSRTATDNVVASGNNVTVATRGVVNVATTAAAVAAGAYVEAADDGKVVAIGTPASNALVNNTLGIALTSVGSAGGTIKVKLLRG